MINRKDTVLLLGSGALKIGEAGEFDYSGTQAIKALKEENKRVILINPNIATIQTSWGLADEIYFYPVTKEYTAKIIQKEHPFGIMLSFGGQTALNTGLDLSKSGILKKYGVSVLGTSISTIEKTENRKLFSQVLKSLGLKTAQGTVISSLDDAIAFASQSGFPIMLRAGFALGGTGSSVIHNTEELVAIVTRALATSPQVVIEESLYGWKEFEYEVVRDISDAAIVVCTMENMDPVGIHTGESIVVAPAQTLDDENYYKLRQMSLDVIRKLDIIGECNIQFAVHPKTDEIKVIEVNARLSRSSALASKATGYPLAYVSAKCALGKRLVEIPNSVTKKTTAFFEPTLDYIVVKIPRWDLAKFSYAHTNIGSEMKSVGEIMSIGRSFEEALQKAIRMLNIGRDSIINESSEIKDKNTIISKLSYPDQYRIFIITEALQFGLSVKDICEVTAIDVWFIMHVKEIVDFYQDFKKHPNLSKDNLYKLKCLGFADSQIARLTNLDEEIIRQKRINLGITPHFRKIDTMAGEFPTSTNYIYCTYKGQSDDYIPEKNKKRAIVLGAGPYAIGTSVEFDWCAVNTVSSLRKHKYLGIIINCNPETMSTDYDISDVLYFEELTAERVLDILDLEKCPVIVSVGGQIPNNLTSVLNKHHVEILGTDVSHIKKAETRSLFSNLLDELNIPQPRWGEAKSFKEALDLCNKLNYPVLLRPSYVLSGKGMSIIRNTEELEYFLKHLSFDTAYYPFAISQFFQDAKECDFDAVSDKGIIVWFAISEHVEGGGVHSGDSAMVHPPFSLPLNIINTINEYSQKISRALGVTGPLNIQYLIKNNRVYVIECNLRASRSIPFVSKAGNINAIDIATEKVILIKNNPEFENQSLTIQPEFHKHVKYYTVKVPQFSFHKVRGSDPVLSVEMRSTGEVAAFGKSKEEAYLVAMTASGFPIPTQKKVFLSLGGAWAKLTFLPLAKNLIELGFSIYATSGTSLFLKENDIPAHTVGKMYEGIHPNISDLLSSKSVDFVVVTPENLGDVPMNLYNRNITDGYRMRRLAVDLGIPILTNIETAEFYIKALLKVDIDKIEIKSWSEFIQEGRK